MQSVADYSIINGKGAEAVVFGRPFWLESHRLMHGKGTERLPAHEAAQSMEAAGHPS